MRSLFQIRCVAALLAYLAISTPAARAMDRDLKDVITVGSYGMLAGTALGLIAFGVTQKPRAIFLGTSTGLYLGLGAGVYHISNRDEPGNPFRAEAEPNVASLDSKFTLYFEAPVFRF